MDGELSFFGDFRPANLVYFGSRMSIYSHFKKWLPEKVSLYFYLLPVDWGLCTLYKLLVFSVLGLREMIVPTNYSVGETNSLFFLVVSVFVF